MLLLRSCCSLSIAALFCGCFLPQETAIAIAQHAGLAEAGVTENTVVVTRRSDLGALYASMNPNGTSLRCDYDGRAVVLSIPIGLKPSDMFAAYNRIYQRAHELVIDRINLAPRCGVAVGGRRHPLELVVVGADSDPGKTAAASRLLASTSDFLLSPYSSGLAYHVSKAGHEAGRVVIANGAVRPDVFRGFGGSFGVLPSGYSYLRQLLPLLKDKGANSIYYVTDGTPGNFVKGLCGYVPDFAADFNVTLKGTASLRDTGDPSRDFDVVARNLSRPELDPDILVSCIDTFCDAWMASLRRVGWSPRALVITVCPGTDFFETDVGTDREYVLGVSPWVPNLAARDAAANWTASEFASVFRGFSGERATYHAAAAAAQVTLPVQAMERADSLDAAAVLSGANATRPFRTLYGDVFFTDIGQADLSVLGVQYDGGGALRVVAPVRLAEMDVVYPMPTWAHRDCVKLSPCGRNRSDDAAAAAAAIGNGTSTAGATPNYGGTCNPDGTCSCPSSLTSTTAAVGVGVGPTAACHDIPTEDMTHIAPPLRAVGVAFVTLQLLASCAAVAWTLAHRHDGVVLMSQPIFLVLVAGGCAILSLVAIPLAVEGDYRDERDAAGELTGEPNADIWRADVACMSFYWLFGIGFVITFSALFAKIDRVRKISRYARNCRRITVKPKDVAAIMVGLLALEVALLLVWQFMAPLRWEREVLRTDENGYPIKSVGKCTSDSYAAFLVPYAALNMGCLLYALYLCYITRNLSQKLNEGKWITASITGIFQVLLLGIPILIIVSDDTSAYFFVRACLVFIVSMSVTCFIFLPKVFVLHGSSGEARDRRRSCEEPLARRRASLLDLSRLSALTNMSRQRRGSCSTTNQDTGENLDVSRLSPATRG